MPVDGNVPHCLHGFALTTFSVKRCADRLPRVSQGRGGEPGVRVPLDFVVLGWHRQ